MWPDRVVEHTPTFDQDLRHVQALLGHDSPDTTAAYLGLVKDDLKRVYGAAIEVILAE